MGFARSIENLPRRRFPIIPVGPVRQNLSNSKGSKSPDEALTDFVTENRREVLLVRRLDDRELTVRRRLQPLPIVFG